MATLNIYKTYSFLKKDPVIDHIRTWIDDADIPYKEIENLTGVSASTLYGWLQGTTRRPQYATVMVVARCLGYEQKWQHHKKNGK